MQSRTNGSSTGHIPDTLSTTGFGSAEAPNKKNASAVRADSLGPVAGAGGASLAGSYATGQTVASDGFPGAEAGNQFNRGSGATEPDPATVNRGYSLVTGAGLPTISECTSANRDNFGFDPGMVDNVVPGDTTPGPSKPNYGVGSTGD